jgi:Tol biopolymer transport system component
MEAHWGARLKGRLALTIAAICLVAAAVLPEAASAVLSGTNGRILFTSARDPFTTATSQFYLRPTFSSSGGPGGVSLINPTSTTQRRHASWSPDRTMIAFAEGDSTTSNFDIFVLDLTDPGATPLNITASNNVTDDRPAWSPDGTRIAWESEVTDGSAQQDILIDAAPFGSADTNLTNSALVTSDAKPAGKPAWSPDSQTLYYSSGDLNVMPNGNNNDVRILQEPSDNSGTPTELVHISGAHAFQPAISPDGTRICYTSGTGFNTTAGILEAPLNNPANGAIVLAGTVAGDYNCTWSPDGEFIAYVDGIFTNGQLVMERSDNSSPSQIFLETTAGRFDGNPDWAPDGRPGCQDQTITTVINTPVQIPLLCSDTGPAYEQTPVSAAVDTEPANGSVSPDDLQAVPASITYTPNGGFRGTDTLTIDSFDDAASGNEGTVRVNVQPASNNFDFGKVKRKAKQGIAKLTVNVPGPGALNLAAGDVKPVITRATSAGNVVLLLKPKAKAKRKLTRTGKARVEASVTFTPDNGDPKTKTTKVKLLLNS